MDEIEDLAEALRVKLQGSRDSRRRVPEELRVEAVACERLNEKELSAADVVIRPDVGSKEWGDFSDLEELVAEGQRAAEEKIPEILHTLDRKKKRGFFQRIFKRSA